MEMSPVGFFCCCFFYLADKQANGDENTTARAGWNADDTKLETTRGKMSSYGCRPTPAHTQHTLIWTTAAKCPLHKLKTTALRIPPPPAAPPFAAY